MKKETKGEEAKRRETQAAQTQAVQKSLPHNICRYILIGIVVGVIFGLVIGLVTCSPMDAVLEGLLGGVALATLVCAMSYLSSKQAAGREMARDQARSCFCIGELFLHSVHLVQRFANGGR